MVTLYNFTDCSEAAVLVVHPQVVEEGVDATNARAAAFLEVERASSVPPARLVFCVVSDGGEEEGEG